MGQTRGCYSLQVLSWPFVGYMSSLLAFQNFETVDEAVQHAIKAEVKANNQAQKFASIKWISLSSLSPPTNTQDCSILREGCGKGARYSHFIHTCCEGIGCFVNERERDGFDRWF